MTKETKTKTKTKSKVSAPVYRDGKLYIEITDEKLLENYKTLRDSYKEKEKELDKAKVELDIIKSEVTSLIPDNCIGNFGGGDIKFVKTGTQKTVDYDALARLIKDANERGIKITMADIVTEKEKAGFWKFSSEI